ncbi:MAG: hypothetical protein KAT48_08200 [Bacteroidales bacterium]|nr:hypothetical protein [Bacteroidales bacterium]
MSKPIKTLNNSKIQDILNENDKRVVFDKTIVIPDEKDLLEKLKEYIKYDDIGNKSVLGIDIFQYSSFGKYEQTLLPFVFKTLFETTIKQCLANHQFIFQKSSAESIEKNFISTGDGGFLIFDTPLHALLFASNLAVTLRIYNSFHFYPRLRKIIGPINLRYAITYDKIYSFENNYFGRAIINNARILIKDNLNRCLIDENVHSWFMRNIDGLENLQIINMMDIINIYEFKKHYDTCQKDILKDEVFESEPSRRYGIINSDILQIGKIQSKETELIIYNLHLQVTLNLYNDEDRTQTRTITVSLGNLNTAGI